MFYKGKLTNKCQIDFANGDQFVGMFRGGNPNGHGHMSYNASIPMHNGIGFDASKYIGSFKSGLRDG